MDETRHCTGPVTREKLIEAAGEIFAEKGPHAASIRDITRRAGANIAAVNYHFRDKAELYLQVLRHAHAGIIAAMSQPCTADTPAGRIREFLQAMLGALLDPARPAWHRRLLGRELFQPTPALDLVLDITQRPSQRLWELVREIRPDLPDDQVMLAASAIVAQGLFHVHHAHLTRRMFPQVPLPPIAVLIDHITDYSLAALEGLPATPAAGPPRTTRRRTAAEPARRPRRTTPRRRS